MTFDLDPRALTQAAAAAEDLAARLLEAVASADFGPTGVDDEAALEVLRDRVTVLSARIGANARGLRALVHDAEAVDSQVSVAFLVLSAAGWR